MQYNMFHKATLFISKSINCLAKPTNILKEILMKKIKVLAIAPYEGLKELMQNTAAEREDIDLQVYVGDLAAGAELAGSVQDIGYDVIISRGGTAEMIEKIAHIPVIEIRLSEYDMMRAIKLAQNYSGKFAIVGFPNITKCTDIICDLLQCKIETFTINGVNEVAECVENMQKMDYSLLVGDAVTVATARQFRMNGILITSGKESINAAFDEAVKLCDAISITRERDNLYKQILDISNIKIAVYDNTQKLLYSNFTYEQLELDSVFKKLAKHVDKVLNNNEIKIMHKSGNNLWSINGMCINQGTEQLAVFFVNRSIEISGLDNNVFSFKNINDNTSDSGISFTSFYGGSGSMKPIVDSIQKISTTSLPLFIYGENGTGKDNIAYTVHTNSNMKNQCFLTIDCSLLNDKQFRRLLDSESSPLCETNLTIYFKNIQCLEESNQQDMVSYIGNTYLHSRNRIIYSSEKTIQDMPCSILADYLLSNSTNSCLTLSLPSLREHKEDIPSLASIYISELNLALGKEVVGLTENAVRLLQDFEWKYNIDQFINVLKQLIIITDTPYINEENVAMVLAGERKIFEPKQGKWLSTDGTLDDIIANVIQTVFEAENMNQSNAAKRLGISRSTLWRKLKQ
jgi:transcriptional regulator with PAS, ATPase and Fis domain